MSDPTAAAQPAPHVAAPATPASSSPPAAPAYVAAPARPKAPGRGYRLTLLLTAILAVLIGTVLLLGGLTQVPAATNLADLADMGTTLGIHVRDQIGGATTLFFGGVAFLLWLTTGALRTR